MTAGPKAALTKRIKNLLTTPTDRLRGLDRQRAFIGGQMLRSPPCPWCHEPVSRLDAAPDDFTIEGHHADTCYVCPHCDGKLMYVLPLFGGVWHWWTRTEKAEASAC